MQWYVTVLKKYAQFTGRSRRQEFWMFYLINLLIGFAIIMVENAIGLGQDGNSGPIYGVYSLAVAIPFIAVGIRRLHDTDRSGWWMLVPIANLVFFATAGQPGPNKYGPDPKADGGYVATAAPAPAAAPPAYNPYGAAPSQPAPTAPPMAAPEPTAAAASAPAEWLADPTGRHELRYWDGQAWTANVSDSGATSTDPV